MSALDRGYVRDFSLTFIYLAREMSPKSIAQQVYGEEADDNYIDEKAAKIKRDFLGWVCDLDSARRRRLNDLCERIATGVLS